MSRIMMLPSYMMERKSVPTRSLIPGRTERLRNGRNSLKVLSAETLLMNGRASIKAVTTTVKSNQFHPSLRQHLPWKIKPIATTLDTHSKVKNKVKKTSEYQVNALPNGISPVPSHVQSIIPRKMEFKAIRDTIILSNHLFSITLMKNSLIGWSRSK